jgi:hypothetical protein
VSSNNSAVVVAGVLECPAWATRDKSVAWSSTAMASRTMTTYIVSLRGAQTGTFADVHQLATALAGAVKEIEQVPDIPMFRKNTAAFVHELPAAAISNVDADSNYVRIQVLTNAGALDRDKQRAVVARLTSIVSDAAGDPSLSDRTWCSSPKRPRAAGPARHSSHQRRPGGSRARRDPTLTNS